MAGFITRWTVAAGDLSITLPLYDSGVFNCVVDWGGGGATSTITTWDDVDKTHTYASAGTYDVEITGECPAWVFNNGGDKLKIVAVVNWGDAADFGGFSFLSSGFYGCTNLTSLGTGKIQAKAGLTTVLQCFRNCAFSTVPSGLFDNCVNLTASGCLVTFYNCTSLTTIPSGLFDNCTAISSNGFSQTFAYCSSLESLPSDLFRYNVACISWLSCFFACTKLQLNKNIFYVDGEQSTRFLNKTVDFTQCFNHTSFTGVQGEAPDLWNCNFGTGSANPTTCFAGAGNSATSLTNYSEIPTYWGGPYGGLLESTSQ